MCNGIVEAANCTQSTQLNPPITELIPITLVITTYRKKNWASKMKEFLALYIVSIGDICSRCIFLQKL